MGNYGLQKRNRKEQPVSVINANTGVPVYSAAANPVYFRESQSTLSFRNTYKGTLVADSVADPYGWFLRSTMESRRAAALEKPGVREYLLSRPAKAQSPDISADFADTGHAFYTSTRRTVTSHPSLRNTFYTSNFSGSKFLGGPFVAINCRLGYWATRIRPTPFPLTSLTSPGGGDETVRGPVLTGQWDSSNMDYYAQKAIANTAPNRPVFSLANSLGEMVSEGLPAFSSAIAGNFMKIPTLKNAGMDYIAYAFGLAPFIRDIAKLSDTLNRATEILHQYEVDSYKGVRRRFYFPMREARETYSGSDIYFQGDVTATSSSAWPGKTGPDTSSSAGYIPGAWIENSEVEMYLKEKIWFTGSYTYYLPVPPAVADRLSGYQERHALLMQHLVGATPTLETMWELAPWSWLVDWFFDVQSTLSAHVRIQDTNLVINYGYLMRTQEKRVRQSSAVQWPTGYLGSFGRVSTLYTTVEKQRVRANPFGFGLKTPEGLSPYQLSILAGIGISRKSGD